MDSISLPVVAPRFDRLKRTGNWLHLLAGALILAHAVSHFRSEATHTLYFWCQLLISLDIFLLVLVGRDILAQMPRLNLLFRLIEGIFFLCIGILMLIEGNVPSGTFHLLLSIAYGYLFYCERAFRSEETLSIHHTGISIPDLPESRFLHWTHINAVRATYDSVEISTAEQKDLRFNFRTNLRFDELEKIQNFCRFYLGA
jgi:hypothetical protein